MTCSEEKKVSYVSVEIKPLQVVESVDEFGAPIQQIIVTVEACFCLYDTGEKKHYPHMVDYFQLDVSGPDGVYIQAEDALSWDSADSTWEGYFTAKIPGSHTVKAYAYSNFGARHFDKFVNDTCEVPIFQLPELPEIDYRTFLRLEPCCRASNNDFSRGLQARIADPLWMLARQWQFGEFQAEDAGSPLEVQIKSSTQAVESVKLGNESPQYLQEVPLEMTVEQEYLELDWRRRVQIGQRFERLINDLDSGAIDNYRMEYSLQPTAEERAQMDKATVRFVDYMTGRVVDGQKLLDDRAIEPIATITEDQIAEVVEQLNEYCVALNIHPKPITPAAWRTEQLDYRFELNPLLYRLFQTISLTVTKTSRALLPTSSVWGVLKNFWTALFSLFWGFFEKFLTALRVLLGLASEGNTPLIAPSYRNGELDWYTFDTSGPLQGAWKQSEQSKLCPTHVSMGGASSRWWAFEDSAIDFGRLDVNKTDIAKLMLMEFVVAYGDDWFSVPLPVATGNLVVIDEFKVRNVFGEDLVRNINMHRDETALRPASRLDHDPLRRWQIYALSPSMSRRPAGDDPGFGNLLFIPPVTGNREESPPLEEVVFLRDEGANMVWAVERTVCNGLGEPTEGSIAHREKAERDRSAMIFRIEQERLEISEKSHNVKSEQQRQILRIQTAEIEAQLAHLLGDQQTSVSSVPRYRLATTVPEHWIPFMPAMRAGSAEGVIRLCRAQMLRNREDETPVTIEGLSRLLKLTTSEDEGSPLLYLEEATIPRSGLRYQLTAQRVRGINGETFVWLGRKVLAGKGEGSSGLRFDVLN